MPSPSDPKRLQIIDRIVTVLRAITAGANYFYTPQKVDKGFIAEKAAVSDHPIYEVISDSGGDIAMHSDGQFAETFYVAILGRVMAVGDVVTPLELALRDVRKAIETDFQPAAGAGSLITIATEIVFDTPPDIDYIPEGVGYNGDFTQRVRVRVDGEFGEI